MGSRRGSRYSPSRRRVNCWNHPVEVTLRVEFERLAFRFPMLSEVLRSRRVKRNAIARSRRLLVSATKFVLAFSVYDLTNAINLFDAFIRPASGNSLCISQQSVRTRPDGPVARRPPEYLGWSLSAARRDKTFVVSLAGCVSSADNWRTPSVRPAPLHIVPRHRPRAIDPSLALRDLAPPHRFLSTRTVSVRCSGARVLSTHTGTAWSPKVASGPSMISAR